MSRNFSILLRSAPSPAAIFPQLTAGTVISDRDYSSKIEQLLLEIRKFTVGQHYVFQSMSVKSAEEKSNPTVNTNLNNGATNQGNEEQNDDDNEEQTRPKF